MDEIAVKVGAKRTRQSRTLLVFVLATGIVGIGAMASLDTTELCGFGVRAIADGRAGSELQSVFDEAVPFRKAAIAALGSLRHSIFGEGYPGVLVGSDGWLFSTEEFDGDLGYLDGRFIDRITRARDTLAARGISLVVMAVPSKGRVMTGKLGHLRMPDAVTVRYQALTDSLESAEVPVVDLYTVYAAYQGDEALYLRTDSHWSTTGARFAAEAAADAIRSVVPELPRTAVETIPAGFTQRTGDLMSYLPALGTSLRALPPPESIPAFETVVYSGAGLFDVPSIPVAIIGTSYSAEPSFHFEGFLKQALSVDVINLAVQGKGPFIPMDEALAGHVLEETGVRVVIWEIPERYIPPEALQAAGVRACP